MSDGDFDPRTIAYFEPVKFCDAFVVVEVGDIEHKARCEQDPGHPGACSAEIHFLDGVLTVPLGR